MDTFGVLSPAGTRHLVESVRALTDLPLEIHPHNDFGLGTANAFAGLEAGASIVHTSMLGLGERLGNTPLEQFAVAAPLLYGYETRLDLSKLREAAELVQRSARIELAPNTPVIGQSYTQIESGTVASEFRRWSKEGKDLQWLFPFVPRLIGDREIELVVGKGSGIANIRAALERLGLDLPEEEQRELLAAAKSEAVRVHRLLEDSEVEELAKRVNGERQAVG
jgi:isopropylmalate/homocitrate/citramalate synthase